MDDMSTPPEPDQPRDEEAVRAADERNGEPDATREPATAPAGTDTPTGTDPDARYERPGYEDKSFGQAVDQDGETAQRLLDEEGGDEDAAAERFEQEATGAPARARQQRG